MRKLFAKKTITLSNGTVVEEKRSKTLYFWIGFLILLAFSIYLTQFNIVDIISRADGFFQILTSMFPPNFHYLPTIFPKLVDTIKMSFIGSLVGAVLALPFAILASTNVVKNRVVILVIRFIFMIMRTLPTLVSAVIAVYLVGIGTMAGAIAIFIFTFSFVGKQMFEIIETVDMGAFEATEALGAGKFKAFMTAIFPQILPSYLSTSLYAFEGNVRYAAILGYVGAGGIGVLINDDVALQRYSDVGIILLATLVVVMIIDYTSTFIRSKIG